jgi:hypothetical protein
MKYFLLYSLKTDGLLFQVLVLDNTAADTMSYLCPESNPFNVLLEEASSIDEY